MDFRDYHKEIVAILDFGSQYTQLIARKVRELGVYCEIFPYNIGAGRIGSLKPTGIILSGGPASVNDVDAPGLDPAVFDIGAPILGICYGIQLIAKLHHGTVQRSEKREYGRAHLFIDSAGGLLEGMEDNDTIWMSHGDSIMTMPVAFRALAHSENSPYAAIGNESGSIYGVQFHPEVHHTPKGKVVLRNFLFNICKAKGLFSTKSFIEMTTARIRDEVGDGKVVCALSGGVDSSVVAALIHRAIGDRLTCVFVNNGVLRKNEAREVLDLFKDRLLLNVRYVDGSERFLSVLKGVRDPEKKRKIIGRTFIKVFEEEALKLGDVRYLAQGTLYPDVIESVSFKGPSATIKSHHNVGGLPKKMRLKLIEPLRELFKDEVRIVGKELGLPDNVVHRQPFPGPGLAIRMIGEVTQERVHMLQEADHIIREEIERKEGFGHIWQSFAILIPIRTVGVMGDERTYAHVIAVRVVESLDGMTADWARIPYDVLDVISRRIINEVPSVNRVVLDISSKPPSTIEWE